MHVGYDGKREGERDREREGERESIEDSQYFYSCIFRGDTPSAMPETGRKRCPVTVAPLAPLRQLHVLELAADLVEHRALLVIIPLLDHICIAKKANKNKPLTEAG